MNRYNDPLFIDWHRGSGGEDHSVKVTKEQLTIINNSGFLRQIPDIQHRVQIDGMFETSNQISSTDLFKVNYANGEVAFHSDLSIDTVEVTKYYGRGVIMYPASRIWTGTNDLGEVVSTLADLHLDVTSAVRTRDELIESTLDGRFFMGQLEGVVDTGTILLTDLTGEIAIARNEKEVLEQSISKGVTTTAELNSVISNGLVTKSDLDGSITLAVSSNTNLTESTSRADVLTLRLDKQILDGGNLNEALIKSIGEGERVEAELPPLTAAANNSKSNLDGSIALSEARKVALDDSIVKGAKERLDLDASISGAQSIDSKLANKTNGTIKQATAIDTELKSSILSGLDTDSELKSTTQSAENTKTRLDNSITSGATTKSNLDRSITTGGSVDAGLTETISTANTIENKLSNSRTGSIKIATDKDIALKGSITTSEGKIRDIDTAISNASQSKTELETSTSQSATSKSQLDTSIGTANRTKEALDGSIVEGGALKGELDGIISGTDYEQILIGVDDLKKDQHTHSNKGVIDGITSTLVSRWNSAWTHISDAVKHITASERAKWNTVDNKADKTYVDNKVKTDVPVNAKFTDTIVDISNKVDKVAGKQLSTNDYTNIEKTEVAKIANKTDKAYVDNKVKTDVPTGAKFTDTTYSAGENISIVNSKISVTGQLGLTEAEVRNVKVNRATNADTVSGKTVGVNVPANAEFTDNKFIASVSEPTLNVGDEWHREY